MFILSVKRNQIKRAMCIICVILAAVVLLIALYGKNGASRTASGREGIRLRAEDAQQRLAFIAQFGWNVKEDPVEITEVFIPEQFDGVYEQYNQIQKDENGLDLSKYKGKRVKRFTYAITNYPGYEDSSETVRIDLLIYSGLVIGGDVCSTELDGFMHGFFPVQYGTQATVESTSAVMES